ncbi:MAG: hypothetical protein K2X01_10170 [Cyanobacteria bacterium]|nr:hypothetical protein [Cyanobacteriota bacterium]
MKMMRPAVWFSLVLGLSCVIQSQVLPLWAKEAPISKKTVLSKTVVGKPGAIKKNPTIATAAIAQNSPGAGPSMADVLKRNNADFARYLFSMQPTINGTQKTQECESEFNNTRKAFDKSPTPSKSGPNTPGPNPNDPANFVLCEPGANGK